MNSLIMELLSDVVDSNSDIFIFGSSSLNGSQYFLNQSKNNDWWQWSKTSVALDDDDNDDFGENSSSTELFDVTENTDSSQNDDALLTTSNTCTIIEHNIPKIESDMLLFSKYQKQQQQQQFDNKTQQNVEIRNQKGNVNGDIKSNSFVQIPPSIFEQTNDNESYSSENETTNESINKINRCDNESLSLKSRRLEEKCIMECEQGNIMIGNNKDDDRMKGNFACFAKRKQQARQNSKKQIVGRCA